MAEWSELEVELIVADYFQMLAAELSGKSYSKAEHRRNLMPFLSQRSEGSVEFKHQNISAVLVKLGQLYIKGYLPRFNYQKILEEKVIEYLFRNRSIESRFKEYVEKEPKFRGNYDFQKIIVEAPVNTTASEPSPGYSKNPIKINYLEREQKNSRLGALGEQLVLEYEKWNLIKMGRHKLAQQVKWIASEEGDGAGFDILSRNPDGTEKYIEVKTTTLGKETPIFFSQNELSFSREFSDKFHLFRIFNFDDRTRFFVKTGRMDKICQYYPVNFKGFF